MKRLVIAACFVLLALPVLSANDQRARVLLQAGEAKEKIEGDLPAAIKLYQEAEKEAGANRALVAQALLKRADAYQSLDAAEAQRLYQRLVDDFGDQTSAAALARARLNRTQQPSPAAPPQGRVDEVVWAGPGVTMDVWPLPDGRSVVHWDLPSGNLALRELATGTTRFLTRDAAGQDWYYNPVSSPSGTRIAVRFGDGNPTIRLVSIDGQRSDVLLPDEPQHWLVGWSPDEKYLAAERWPGDGTVTFVLISTADGSARQLTTLPGGSSLGGFSADGRHLVFTKSAAEGSSGGVYLLAVDGSAVVPLWEGPHRFARPMWTPDGRHVFFSSDRSGGPALWSLEVVNGRPVGEPVLRDRGFNANRPLGFTRDGSLFYGQAEQPSDVFLVDFDPVTLRAANPKHVTEDFVGRNSYPVLSPDGRHVAFVRRAGSGPSVVLRSLDSKQERTLLTFQRPYGANTLHWFPDGNALLLTDRIEQRKRFRKIDIATGASTTLFDAPWSVWTGALSPDGTTLYYSMKDDEGVGNRLVKRHLESGVEEELYRTPAVGAEGIGLFGLSVSPSGDSLAFARNVEEGCPAAVCRLLMVMSTRGGEPQALLTSPLLFFQGPIGWTPDSRQLIISVSDAKETTQQLHALAVDSGKMTPLGVEMPQITSRVVSSDGRRIAITRESLKNEIRVLRNILPR